MDDKRYDNSNKEKDEIILLKEKLSHSEKRLSELVESRRRIASILSHDIRSPFNGLLGFTNLLSEEAEDLSGEEIKSFSKNIHAAAKGLLDLLDDLYIWTLFDSDKMDYEPAAIDLKYLIGEIFFKYQSAAADKKIVLVNNIGTDAFIYGDFQMISTVFQNLLSNAIKFTLPGGEVKVSIQSSGSNYEIFVEDNGVGIHEDIMIKLFSYEEHITTRGTSNEKGTGLGLIICKGLLNKNNGVIKIKSIPGNGTKVIVTLPKMSAVVEN